jgi:hypothetical protein
MADTPQTPPQDKRSIWMRALMMILMGMAFQLAATLLGLIAVVQWILALFSDTPNARLACVGKAVGSYLRQIADFVSFDTEEVPFPFSDWPSPN